MVVLHLKPASTKLPPSLNDIDNSKMSAKAILTSRSPSHPFQERTLILDQPVKIGRSMARARPSSGNGIFDCKVLSRNHALLWFENGKFFLQDTKSSNGTFVNNQRLSKGTEESPPREVFSGDIVQFGVTVIENSRKGKAVHDCIISTLKLLFSDGREAKPCPSTVVLPLLPSPGTMPTQDLYQISQFIQEALHREQILQDKLEKLQKIVHNSQEASESGWKVLIDEDRLLTRLEILENQLQTYSKNFSNDKLREEITKLQEDKNSYQSTAKESLVKVLQEKLEAINKLQDTECSLTNTKTESSLYQDIYENAKAELQDLATKYNDQLQELTEVNEKLQEEEQKQLETSRTLENEKNVLQEKVADLTIQVELLQVQVESLEAEKDFTSQQLSSLKAYLEQEETKAVDEDTKKEDSRALLNDSEEHEGENAEDDKKVPRRTSDSIFITYKKDPKDEDELSTSPPVANHVGEPEANITNSLKAEIEKLKELLEETREKKVNTEAEVTKYKGELNEVIFSAKEHADEISHMKQQLQQAQQTAKEKSDTVTQLLDQLTKAQQTSKQSHNEAEQLRNKIKNLTEELDRLKEQAAKDASEANTVDNKNTSEYLKLKEDYSSIKNRFQVFEVDMRKTKNENVRLVSELKKLQDAYKVLESKKNKVVCTDEGVMQELQEARTDADKSRQQLFDAQEEIIQVKLGYTKSAEEKNKLKEDLTKLEEDYQLLSYQTRTISAVSIIPLILLAFGFVLAFYPTMAKITATTEPPYPP